MLGQMLNFGRSRLGFKRFVFSNLRSSAQSADDSSSPSAEPIVAEIKGVGNLVRDIAGIVHYESRTHCVTQPNNHQKILFQRLG